MEKRKRWQKLVILAVLFLTVYNILPTIFFYSKPLKKSVTEQGASQITSSIIERVNGFEQEATDWLDSFCKLLKVNPHSISLDEANPQYILITFKTADDASVFRKFLPRAGSLIPFVPSQLSLHDSGEMSKTVTVQRKIPIHFDSENSEKYFQFSRKFDDQGIPTPLYRALTFDRAAQIAMAAGGASEQASLIEAALTLPKSPQQERLILKIASQITSANKVLKHSDQILKRYYASFSQIERDNPQSLIDALGKALEQTKDQIKLQRINLQSEGQSLQSSGKFLETSKQQRLEILINQENILSDATTLLKKHQPTFAQGKNPFTFQSVSRLLEEGFAQVENQSSKVQLISLNGRNPFIKSIELDWDLETISLNLYSDLEELQGSLISRNQTRLCAQLKQLVINEVAANSRLSGEKFTPLTTCRYEAHLESLQGSDRFLAMRLSEIASARADEIVQTLKTCWKPRHSDLKRGAFPIWSYETYQTLPAHEKKLGLVVYAPAAHSKMTPKGLNNSSIYVLAKGLDKIIQKLQTSPNSEQGRLFFDDFNSLKALLQQSGLFGYPGTTLTTSREFASDFVFEAQEFYLPVLNATREEFNVNGTKRFAILELTNNEQRILAENKIQDQIHEELLKWRDDHNAARIGIGGASPHDVPKPTKNPLVHNLLLSLKKYFRGDNRKVLNWGLDLSGGKTVQIELRDQGGQLVNGDEKIKQGINELFDRVNKMGVSEVSIRREGNFITLDFPGSQELSAAELIKASTMHFHIVNEKFNEKNPSLAETSNQFLQDVWNEAVVTGRKTPQEINQIAWHHIHGDSFDPDLIQPRSDAARILYENGLRLTSPLDHTASNLFSDATSKIAMQRGEDFTEWKGKTHPLMIVFHNYAIEGSYLKNVQAAYDQNKGNMLNFEIRGKETLKTGEKINPRADLFAWTSQYSKDKIAATPNASYSSNEGWRMAVVLNGSIITSPTLNFPIQDNASIEGSFTAREVNQLEADLKAGSLSFTPHILSEKNVSPELGSKERVFGISATLLALVLVIGCMISYYRFGGFIASIAVIVNLLIMWATLQNLGATLTLATIAGGILTLGMAVDANVLVFERIREEFAQSSRLATAVGIGYRKAFSAILDSNVTTIIAAIILMQFDSGPIKGFAITLIIGIASSMFTALFMTRYFFTGWVANPKRTTLKMAQLIKVATFQFLKHARPAFTLSAIIILLGALLFVKEKSSILGMDFTGGYSLNLELAPKEKLNYRLAVEEALTTAGASAQDIQVQQLTPPHHIRLFLGKGMGSEGKPFFEMPLEIKGKNTPFNYEINPRIKWVVDSLNRADVAISANSLPSLDQNWSEISGQLSDSMRNSALIGLGIAILSILAYITIRFEFKYAASATLCLAHDIAITLATIAILHFFGMPIQIDLNTVAALMTIVGYSLNDTIIVFDRIRENRLVMRKSPFAEIINHALNITLSRTIMTSMTTLLVLLPLILLGGSTIFAFSLVMIIGVIFGTLSSLFIAAPMLRFFHSRGENKETAAQIVQQ